MTWITKSQFSPAPADFYCGWVESPIYDFPIRTKFRLVYIILGEVGSILFPLYIWGRCFCTVNHEHYFHMSKRTLTQDINRLLGNPSSTGRFTMIGKRFELHTQARLQALPVSLERCIFSNEIQTF